MNKKLFCGHLFSVVTIIIWATTFVSTKILLDDFHPVEILFCRFFIGFMALCMIFPKRLKKTSFRQELTFAAAGLCGVCLYYLLENIALTYTTASNVGVIISSAPLFTAVLSCIFVKPEVKLNLRFYIGFVIAMAGIVLVSFNGGRVTSNPVGDILSVAAALVWAVYSVLTNKIGTYGFNIVQTTRRIFLYGILFMIPMLFVFDVRFDLSKFTKPDNLVNMIFLGFAASALCFVLWNFSVKTLGAVKTSIYIYAVPVITVAASAVVLNEKITAFIIFGTILTIVGLFLSQSKRGVKNECKK